MGSVVERKRDPKDKWILIYFVMFFGLIIVVNSIFIYFAINSHSGVVIKKPYERGLTYDETLHKSKAQPKLNDNVSYKGGVLSWTLKDEAGHAIENGIAQAMLIRPVQDGHDFKVMLEHAGGGIYKTILNTPLKGQWDVRLKVTWDNTQYQAAQTILVE